MKKIHELVSSFRNIPRLFSLVYRTDKLCLIYMILETVCFAALPYPTIFLVKYSFDLLEKSASDGVSGDSSVFARYAVICVSLILTQFAIAMAKSLFNSLRPARTAYVTGILYNDFHRKSMELDYELLAEKDIQDLQSLVGRFLQYNFRNTIWNFVSLFSSLAAFIVSCALISGINIFLILIVIAGTLLSSFVSSRFAKAKANINDEITKNDRYIKYYDNVIVSDEYAKDIRIFEMGAPISERLDTYYKKKLALEKKKKLLENIHGCMKNGCSYIIELVIYAFLGYFVLSDGMSIGTLSLLLGNIAIFRSYLEKILDVLVGYSETAKYVDYYNNFMSLKSKFRLSGSKPFTLTSKDDFVIEFKNVSFRYPGQENCALENFNLRINSGEKLSVVGENGSGKSTFMKLLMRLYDPTEGEILINGTNIRAFDYDQYISIFAPIFQDYKLFAFTVAENISSFEDCEPEAVAEAGRKSGIDKRISELPGGYDTYISKRFDDLGVDFSGGEEQKIAISRAYFKQDSLITILDEPTSALDPKAEHELYCQFNDYIGDRTALFISHRLSSSKFCDKIVVIKDRKVFEFGTHDELMKRGGYYCGLFNMQASYYDETVRK